MIEPQKILGKSIEEYFLSRGPEYAVLSAESVPEALELMEHSSVDLVISEHRGPGEIDGLELLEGTRGTEMAVRVILCAEPALEFDSDEALAAGCDTFLVKPIPVHKLCELVFNMLQPERGFSGRLVGMKLEDVVEMLCFRKDSSVLSVTSGTNNGIIYVHEGAITHAQCDSLSGVEAVYEILGWEEGEFYSQVVLDVPPQTVFTDWQSLLMEGIRQKDEIKHALGPESVAQPVVESSATEPAPGTLEEFAPPLFTLETVEPLRIMVVDDSRLIRKIVQEIIEADPDLTVVGYAANGREALARIEELQPDLILLDWDMPVMMGGTTLMHIMIRSPCPVVILSGFVGGAGASSFDLLCLGAVDFMRKPQSKWRTDGRADDLLRRVKQAGQIRFERIRRLKIPAPVQKSPAGEHASRPGAFLSVLAASTGGCTDLIRIVPRLPADFGSPIVVLHDMQPEALGPFIDYLDSRSQIEVRPVEPDVTLIDRVCYIHPATVPVELGNREDGPALKILSELPDSGVTDHFLVSASKVMGDHLLAVLLSGSAGTGIEGFRAVKKVDGITIAQDPASSVDPGMAAAVLVEGLVDHTCSADELAAVMQELIR
jgi:two-component system chemotaxis response regulator CheB